MESQERLKRIHYGCMYTRSGNGSRINLAVMVLIQLDQIKGSNACLSSWARIKNFKELASYWNSKQDLADRKNLLELELASSCNFLT